MGTVYRAVRADDEYHQQVAIKVVKRGMDTDAMLGRFRHERQILAGLDHPHIARLMDGGSTASHQPFFVLEYVEGSPIDEFCRNLQLDIEQRCRLFLRVCEVVAYAHRNLVVHRDLKPSNIIVRPDGTPKLLDFGVAKLLSPDGDSQMTATGLARRALTPDYASPEQVRGLAVTTATDVYSLGAVLYELLTGSRAQQVSGRSGVELEQIVCDTEVARPSSRQRQLAGDLDNILLMAMRKAPERRYSSVEQFAADMERYLNGRPVIARQDSLRYRAGKYFRRHRIGLAAAAVVAASPLAGTIVSVSEARKAQVARAVAESSRQTAERERLRAEDRTRQAVAALESFSREHAIAEQQRALAVAETSRARSEQRRAEQRLTQLVQLANRSLFDVHQTIATLPGATAARRQIVSTTLDYLEAVAKDAGNDDRLRLALGTAYMRVGDLLGNPNSASLGDTTGALKSYLRANALIEPLIIRKPENDEAVAGWLDLQGSRGSVLTATGQARSAAGILLRAVPAARALSRRSPQDSREANLHQHLASALQYENPAQAIEYARQGIAAFTRLSTNDPADTELRWGLSAVHSLMGGLIRSADPKAALEHYRESARLREEIAAREPDNAAYRRSLMLAYGQIGSAMGDSFAPNLGDVDGARTYYRKAAAIAEGLRRADPINRVAQYDVASAELRLGALPASAAGRQELLALLQNAATILEDLAKGDPRAIRYQRALGIVYEYKGNHLRDAGRQTEAMVEYRKSLAVAEGALLSDPKDISTVGQALASERAIAGLLLQEGDQAGAIDYLRKSVTRAERALNDSASPARGHQLAESYLALAETQSRLGARREVLRIGQHRHGGRSSVERRDTPML